MLDRDALRLSQRLAIDFMYEGDQTLLLADVGTGKTVMALTVLQDWINEGVCTGALVLAPKRVCLETWLTEIHHWKHLDPNVLHIGCAAGAPPSMRIRMLETREHKIVLLNYENLPWLMERYPEGLPNFNVLVMDEVDKLKDSKTKRFKGTPRRRGKNGEQLPAIPGIGKSNKPWRPWREHFEIHVGMTGTPVPNHMLDLWAEAYMIDGGARLGDNFYEFRQRHFYQSDWMGYKHELLPGREDWIYDQLDDIVHRIAAEPGKDQPTVRELPPRWLEMAPGERSDYRRLEREYIVELRKRRDNAPDDAALVEADNAGVLYGKLRQMSQGFVYVEDEDGNNKPMVLSHQKLDELSSLISELQGQPLMIVYHYRAQLEALQNRFGKRLAYLGGGQTDKQAGVVIEAWNDNRVPLLAVQPQSAGHGLNLQKGGAHHIAMLTLPETSGLYKQVIGRLARGGNPAGEVLVHRILVRGTVDEERDAIVHGKILTENDLLAAMEARQ